MPKVSVILTSFNHEKYLREAIDSVLNQTFTDYELIIWDDASADGSWAVINSYSDPRIKSFRNEISKRGIYGINKAISEVATGEYIAIHHSDDVWEPDKLEKQVAYLDAHPEIGAVFTNALAIGEDSLPLADKQHYYSDIFNQPNRTRHEWLRFFFSRGNALCHPSVLIRKACYTNCGFYRYGFAQVGDFDMWIRLCLKYEIHVLPERLVRFRVRDNAANTSASRPETRIRDLYEFYKLLPIYRKIKYFDDLVKIFPSAEKYNRDEETDMDFVLAMVALEEKPFHSTQLFGLDLLFEAISDPKRAANIKHLYVFDYKSFITLTGQYDVFSREEVAQWDGRLRDTINLMHNTISWRITKPLRILGQLFRRMKNAADNERSGSMSASCKASQAIRLRVHGLLVQLRTLADKLVKGTIGSSIAYIRARPTLRMRLFDLANKMGVANLIHGTYERIQAFSEGGISQLRLQVVSSYPIWSANFDTPGAETIHQLECSTYSDSLVFIIAHFDEVSEQYAEELAVRLVKSVGQQWQAVFVFGPNCKSSTAIQDVQRATHSDTRISFNFSQVEPDAEFVVLIQGGALPRSHALRIFADALRSKPDALVAYSDEDQFNSAAPPGDPWFKPRFSPLLASQGVLLGRMLAFRPEACGAQSLLCQLATSDTEPAALARSYALNAGEARVMHIPHVLFHDAMPAPLPLTMNLSLPVSLPLVSIVIPTRDRWDLLGPCLESLKNTDWPAERLEIIVVDNGSTEPTTMKMLAEAEGMNLVRVIRDDKQFNWSRLNNLAVGESRGELLIFLNNDTEMVDQAWLKKLAVHALRPGTGAVGCKLLYPDYTVQHGGVIAGIQGVAGHAHLLLQANEGGYHDLANITHEVIAVTGACLAVLRDNFEAAGGFNENFRISFNDIVFCFALHILGKRNIYVADALFIHHESKSRGYDDTLEKLVLRNSEARKAWTLYPQLMRDDPFYSPNLSLWAPYELSFAPRRRSLWDDQSMRPPRVMMLSTTHAVGHGVAVVVAMQAEALVREGYEVIIAGPRTANDFPYPGCDRVEVRDPRSAATLAASRSVDLIIVETPPFFSVARWTGAHPPVLAIDHGEPPPDWFPDAEGRRSILAEKDQALVIATAVFTISDAVAAESRTPVQGILPNGNSHLGQWNEAANTRRQRVRMEHGWDERFVVLNVCRFHRGERLYKGVDTYADVHDALKMIDPELTKRTLFVLCGKGSPEDVEVMTKRGLIVAANVTDEEMTDLYCAADAYANFSKWEGYNLGIGQALAMGLPCVASDIPAHRAFGIDVTNNVIVAAEWLDQIATQRKVRTPKVWNWDDTLSLLIDEVDSICGRPTTGLPSHVSASTDHPNKTNRILGEPSGTE